MTAGLAADVYLGAQPLAGALDSVMGLIAVHLAEARLSLGEFVLVARPSAHDRVLRMDRAG